MSAAPFGGHPTFAQYLTWAMDEGCTVKSGLSYDDEGRPHAATIITAPSGRWVIEVVDQWEYLSPTTIDRLDRRLDLKSPFFSLPHPGS